MRFYVGYLDQVACAWGMNEIRMCLKEIKIPRQKSARILLGLSPFSVIFCRFMSVSKFYNC